MEEVLKGLVVGGINYGESDKILNVFTLENGLITAKIKGVKKAGAKLRFAAEPFCFAEFVFVKNGDKRTVTGASLIDSFYPIREEVSSFFCAGAVAEYIRRFAREGMPSPELFYSAVSALKDMAYGEKTPKKHLAKFLVSALKISGYALDFGGCKSCGKNPTPRVFFDAESGGFVCEDCFDNVGREISHITYEALVSINGGETATEEESVFALRLLDYYIKYKTDEKINSLQELIK